MKALARILTYKPSRRKLDGLVITGYDVDEVDWKPVLFRSKGERLVNRMAVEASALAYNYRKENSYTQAIVEAPGLVVWEGEGEVKDVSTVFYPLMTRLERIIIYKGEGEKLIPVKTIDVGREFYIYDGALELEEPMEYDAIGFDTEKGLRILLKDELYIPVYSKPAATLVAKTTKTRKKTKRKKAAKKETTKKTRKKKSRKKRRTRRKKKK